VTIILCLFKWFVQDYRNYSTTANVAASVIIAVPIPAKFTSLRSLLTSFRTKSDRRNETIEDSHKMIKTICRGLNIIDRSRSRDKNSNSHDNRKYNDCYNLERLQYKIDLIIIKSNSDLSNYDYNIILICDSECNEHLIKDVIIMRLKIIVKCYEASATVRRALNANTE
jgi:hypothetical protein